MIYWYLNHSTLLSAAVTTLVTLLVLTEVLFRIHRWLPERMRASPRLRFLWLSLLVPVAVNLLALYLQHQIVGGVGASSAAVAAVRWESDELGADPMLRFRDFGDSIQFVMHVKSGEGDHAWSVKDRPCFFNVQAWPPGSGGVGRSSWTLQAVSGYFNDDATVGRISLPARYALGWELRLVPCVIGDHETLTAWIAPAGSRFWDGRISDPAWLVYLERTNGGLVVRHWYWERPHKYSVL